MYLNFSFLITHFNLFTSAGSRSRDSDAGYCWTKQKNTHVMTINTTVSWNSELGTRHCIVFAQYKTNLLHWSESLVCSERGLAHFQIYLLYVHKEQDRELPRPIFLMIFFFFLFFFFLKKMFHKLYHRRMYLCNSQSWPCNTIPKGGINNVRKMWESVARLFTYKRPCETMTTFATFLWCTFTLGPTEEIFLELGKSSLNSLIL